MHEEPKRVAITPHQAREIWRTAHEDQLAAAQRDLKQSRKMKEKLRRKPWWYRWFVAPFIKLWRTVKSAIRWAKANLRAILEKVAWAGRISGAVLSITPRAGFTRTVMTTITHAGRVATLVLDTA